MPTQQDYDEEARAYQQMRRGLHTALNAAIKYRGEAWAYDKLAEMIEYRRSAWFAKLLDSMRKGGTQ